MNVLARGLLLSAAAALTCTAPLRAQEIIVESHPDGQNASGFKPVEGNWLPSEGKSKAPGLTATKAMFHDIGQGKPAAARFTISIPANGKYEVFSTYPPSGNATGVIYKIHTAEGDKEVPITQNGRLRGNKPPADEWFSLGKFQFKAGSEAYVEVRDPATGQAPNDKEPNRRIYADAIKLVGEGSAGAAGASAAAPARAPAQRAAGTPSTAPNVTPAVTLPGLASAAPTASSALPAGGPTPAAAPSLGGTSVAANTPAPALSAMPSLPTPLSAAVTPSLGGLPSLPTPVSAAGISAPSGLPSLPLTAPAAAGSALPSLGVASAATPTMPSLGEAGASTRPAVPPLGSVGSGSSSSSGLPALGALPSPAPFTAAAGSGGVPSLPGLGTPSSASGATAPASNSGLPGLTALTGQQTAAASSTPAPDSPFNLSGTPASSGAPSGLPALGTPAPGLSAIPALETPASAAPPLPDVSQTLPGATALATPVGTPADNIQWSHDFGAAQASARTARKNILIFFIAKGNRDVARYEREYFTDPAVRAAMDQFILLKVDFPSNTKLGYTFGILGAGMFAIADAVGGKIAIITQMPKDQADFASQLNQYK